MVDDPDEIRRREARARQIRAQIQNLASPDHASAAPPDAPPPSPRDFIAGKMRDRDETDH